ncbi:MAG: TetR/AcrR family transcriptional regulator [Phycisphaeraceae bacterium]|nr:TetR/AcrR family transcriptional regulator [Phycisphaeraceae bacterium]
MTPSATSQPDTRTRILDAAARLFHEQGFNATGVSTILREAGVNPGSLYNLFPSKDALLASVLERYKELLYPVVMAPVEARTNDPIERVFALLQQYRDWFLPLDFRLGCPIGNLALEVADSHPEIRPLIQQNFDGWCGFVTKWLKEAGDRLPRDLDRDQVAQTVLTVMEGGLMQARSSRSASAYDASVGQLRAYFDLLLERASAGRSST